jgi:hypothetical protein
MKYAILTTLVMFSGVVFADPPDNRPPDNRPPNHDGQNPVSVEVVNNGGTTTAQSTTDVSSSVDIGGDTISVVGGSTGESTASSHANSGDSSAAVGDIALDGGSADSAANVGVSVDTGNETAATAASVIVGRCQNGASGQTRDGGIGLSYSDQLCDYWSAAEVAWTAYQRELAICGMQTCVTNCSNGFVEAELLTCSGSEQADKYLADYRWNLEKAQDLLDSTEHTSTADRVASQLFRPIGLIGLLIWGL